MDDLQVNPSAGANENTGLPEPVGSTTPVPSPEPVAPATPSQAPAEPKPMMVETTPSSSFDLSGLSTPQQSTEKPATPEPLFEPSNEQPAAPGITVSPEEPAKSGALKLALIIGAIVLVAGAAGAAIFFGKGGFPFKGSFVNNELKLAPIEKTTQATQKFVCPTDQYAPLFSYTTQQTLQLMNDDSPQNTLRLLNQVPAANAQLRMNLSELTNNLNATNLATKTTQEPTQQTMAAPILNTAVEKIMPQPPNTVMFTQQATQETQPGIMVLTATQEPTEETTQEATQEFIPGSMVPITTQQRPKQTSIQTNRCINIPHENLVPDGEQCSLINTLYADPATYLLNDTTELHLKEWYSKCNPPKTTLTCGENEELNSTNDQCLCKTNYKRNNVTQQCDFDCDTVIQQIQELRSTPTKSPETNTELVNLQNLATQNACNVPTEENQCDNYKRLAEDAFAQGNFDDYLVNAKLMLDNNCSGENTTCEKMLIEATFLKKVIGSIQSDTAKKQYQDQLDATKNDYYKNTQCNNVASRCSEIEQGRKTGTQETTMTLTPGSVFQDDDDYYQRYCPKPTQQEPKLICTSNPASGFVGQSVEWTATVEGFSDTGTNPFSFSWSGDAIGNTQTVKATYTTKGTKTAGVMASRDGQQLRATCSSEISDVSPAMAGTAPDGGGTPPSGYGGGDSPATAPAKLPPPAPVSSPPVPSPSKAPLVAASSPKTATSPEATPMTESDKVMTESKTVPPGKILLPAAPSTATSQQVEKEKITPATGKDLHAAATEVAPEKTPPEITPTGPEIYLYLIGFLATQLFFFRRRIYQCVMLKK